MMEFSTFNMERRLFQMDWLWVGNLTTMDYSSTAHFFAVIVKEIPSVVLTAIHPSAKRRILLLIKWKLGGLSSRKKTN
jgi:hypothetical protein